MMRNIWTFGIFAVSLAACSGGGGGSPSTGPKAVADFQPATVTVHAAAYDYFGVFEYSASANGVPKPIAPASGALACNGGYSVPLQIRSGPDLNGLVRDQYVVLPLLTSPPAGKTLTCTSEWGIYDTNGKLLASDTLNATVVYDGAGPSIAFSPSTATVSAGGGSAPIFIEYTSATGFSIKPETPADGTLSCPDGYAPTTQLRAGPGKSGVIEDQLVISTASIAPPPGTTLPCTTTYELLDPTSTVVAQATLAVTLQY